MRKKLFIALLLLIFVFSFYQIRKSPLSPWNGRSRLSLALTAEPSVVASLEPGKNLIILQLPENLYFDLPHGFGQYPLGSVYELGELEGRGGELLREAMENYLGIPVEGWAKISNNHQCEMPNCLLLLLQGRGETNLNKLDLLRLWWEMKKLRADKVKVINLQETNILTEKSLHDGSLILETEFFRLDELVKKYFPDSQIKKEGIRIGVLNATDHLGLANKISRLVRNTGGEMISVGNAETKESISKIQCLDKNIKESYTVRQWEKILGGEAEIGEMGESRADVLILVGEYYWEKLTKR